jgi:hypothetical protein
MEQTKKKSTFDDGLIYNNMLRISGNDIQHSTDILELQEWKKSLAIQRTTLMFGHDSEMELPPRLRKRVLCLRKLEKLTHIRINDLRCLEYFNTHQEHIDRLRRFMSAARKVLPRWQFDIIMEKGQTLDPKDI